MPRPQHLKPRHAPHQPTPTTRPPSKRAQQPPKPKSRRPRIHPLLPLLLLATTLAPLLITLHAPDQNNPSPTQPKPFPHSTKLTPPALCHIIGANPARPTLWQLNSRALCLEPAICYPTSAPHTAYIRISPRPPPTCTLSTTLLHPRSPALSARASTEFASCPNLHRTLVTCAHGPGLVSHRPRCPPETTISPSALATGAHGEVRWLEDVTILVPEYPFPANIYHYATVVSYIAFVTAHLDQLLSKWGLSHVRNARNGPYFPPGGDAVPRAVNVVFKGEPSRYIWQRGLMEAVLAERAEAHGIDLRVEYARGALGDGLTCARNAVVLGFRGHVNVWPFANDTAVRVDGRTVPVEAVAVKGAVYRSVGLAGVDVFGGEVRVSARHRVLRLPPLVVGYARRLGAGEDGGVGGNVRPGGRRRRFSEADEAWFVGMLREETARAGIGFRVFTTRGTDSFAEQVRNIEQVGAVVGIHGANLVNAMFMRPFGALLEIFPFRVSSRCYVAGGNSGLAYWSFTASEVEGGGVGEGGCDQRELACRLRYRQRGVWLGAPRDKENVAQLVREVVRYLKGLHERFPEGVPVEMDTESGSYLVVDDL